MDSIILAGGKSLRLGSNKMLAIIAGKSLIQRVIERLATFGTEIIIVTSQASDEVHPRQFGWERNKPSCYSDLLAMTYSSSQRIRVVSDIYPGKGSLGGIYTGLVALSCSYAIVVGCDMPFLNIDLLHYMAQLSQDYDAVVPRVGGVVEPLCAVYSKNCLTPIYKLLENNELKVSRLLSRVKVRYIEDMEVDRFDREHLSFLNINTQADLDKAKDLAVKREWIL